MQYHTTLAPSEIPVFSWYDLEGFEAHNREPITERNGPSTLGRLCFVEEARANPVFGGLPVGLVAMIDTAEGAIPAADRTRPSMEFISCQLFRRRRCRCDPMDDSSDDGVRDGDSDDDDDGDFDYDSDSSVRPLTAEERQERLFRESAESGDAGSATDPRMITPQK